MKEDEAASIRIHLGGHVWRDSLRKIVEATLRAGALTWRHPDDAEGVPLRPEQIAEALAELDTAFGDGVVLLREADFEELLAEVQDEEDEPWKH